MYEITRKNRIKEPLRLRNEDGTLAHTINVDLNVDSIAARAIKAYEMLGMAQNALQKAPNSPEALDAYGNAVIALFNVIFGEEDAGKIVAFYENNWTEMLLDIFPFINNEIMHRIQAASAARKAQLLEAARLSKQGNRAQRRKRRM